MVTFPEAVSLARLESIDPLGSLQSVLGALRKRTGAGATQGLADPLVVSDPGSWIPATELLHGTGLADLLGAAHQRWRGSGHVDAALAWKWYTYWLAMPAVLSWATARRVPLVDAEHVLFQVDTEGTFVRLGLRTRHVALLPSDPLVRCDVSEMTVVADERALLETLRMRLLDQHLDPLSRRIRGVVKVADRALRGSVASGLAQVIFRSRGLLPGRAERHLTTLLDAFDLAGLVEITTGAAGEPLLRRHTCCFAFTLPQPKVCACCCLRWAGRPGRRLLTSGRGRTGGGEA
jgi:hypothetical protein